MGCTRDLRYESRTLEPKVATRRERHLPARFTPRGAASCCYASRRARGQRQNAAAVVAIGADRSSFTATGRSNAIGADRSSFAATGDRTPLAPIAAASQPLGIERHWRRSQQLRSHWEIERQEQNQQQQQQQRHGDAPRATLRSDCANAKGPARNKSLSANNAVARAPRRKRERRPRSEQRRDTCSISSSTATRPPLAANGSTLAVGAICGQARKSIGDRGRGARTATARREEGAYPS